MGERGKLTRILRDASPRESPVGRAPHCRARGPDFAKASSFAKASASAKATADTLSRPHTPEGAP